MSNIWIYHERQEALLCGQHALNNFVQTASFTPGDLSDIAHQLDQMEMNYMANNENGVDSKEYIRRLTEGSGNVDASGNFSIEVLRSALMSRYDVSLHSISSETISTVEITTLPGFICHKDSHWFAIRRINARYWDLNSTLERPNLISNFRLALEIENLRDSGYSVFTLTIDDGKKLPPVCTTEEGRLRGAANFWWKEDDLVKGKTNAMNEANNPWRNVGTGMRLDGKTPDNMAMGNMTEEEMMQMALSASMQEAVPSNLLNNKFILTSEPPATEKGAVRIQFRLPNGKKIIRRFLETEPIGFLYKFVDDEVKGDENKQGKRLELRSGFPPKSLEKNLEASILDLGLSGGSVQARFV